jgi:putative component of toxin-antitoxin plasmid stabilization module
VLFSREEVAAFINQNFEPAWEMVRKVPIIRIDFGNGRVATRTLHGNVASYVCTGDGQVLDILPGIYMPVAYTAALEQLRALALETLRLPSLDVRQTRLRAYHQGKARILRAQAAQIANLRRLAAQPGGGGNFQPNPRLDVGKGRVEMRVEQGAQARLAFEAQQALNALQANVAATARPRTASELASWAPLAVDTQRNETERRLLIHERFATADPVRPEQIKRWLYKDVLHTDLDDPYLGLGDDFFADLER